MWSFPIRISLHVTRSIPAYSIPSKIKLPTSCSLQGPGVKFSLQGVRVGPLVKSARSSIWPMDRSGSILKGKGSKGSRTYRSVVPQTLAAALFPITAQWWRRNRRGGPSSGAPSTCRKGSGQPWWCGWRRGCCRGHRASGRSRRSSHWWRRWSSEFGRPRTGWSSLCHHDKHH